ncbi:ABC transporter substrate-binding protein [Marinicrinis lubricantis]|uniref:ABC transporter substrate-binding protein n=1 Tax=Marinicrinis lubricantis TaxID=2086470 RepID=A0ABW1IP51_9BACL
MKLKWAMSVFLSFSIGMTGCTFGGNDAQVFDSEEIMTLKVMYYDEQSFFREYGNLFNMKYPNVNIEVISTQPVYSHKGTDPKEALVELIETEKPDVIYSSGDYFEMLAGKGMLRELDPLIERDEYAMETYHQGVLDYIRETGDGRIYGLSPGFYVEAVYYNTDLFDTYGVKYPHDGMTWEELFQLAQRFGSVGSNAEQVYGLYLEQFQYNGFISLVTQMGWTEKLSMLDADAKKVTINTPAWKRIHESALQLSILQKPEPLLQKDFQR